MKKQVLSFDLDYDYQIFGISCHLKDYRLCYFLNNSLSIRLTKEEDFTIHFHDKPSSFSFYKHIFEDEGAYVYLLQNRSSEGGYLITEYKQADFIFIIENGEGLFTNSQDYLGGIKEINAVLTAFEIDYHSLKHKDLLIFD